MAEKQNLVEEALIQMKSLENVVSENAKGILASTMKEEIKESLAAIVGPENFSDQLMDLVSYSTDATEHSHRPEAAVWVTNADQVSHVLTLCNRERIPVTARGAGTSLAGLSVPVRMHKMGKEDRAGVQVVFLCYLPGER